MIDKRKNLCYNEFGNKVDGRRKKENEYMYTVEHRGDTLFIGYPPEERREADTKYKTKVFLIWGLISIPISVIGFIWASIAHGILFFVVLGLGGLYICINMIKRVKLPILAF